MAFERSSEATPLVLPVRYNHGDELAALITDASRSAEQDPAVVARCPEILLEAAALCCRFARPGSHNGGPSSTAVMLDTPECVYPTPEGAEGLVHLSTFLLASAEEPAINWQRSFATLLWRVGNMNPRPWIEVGVSKILCYGRTGIFAGGHAELNRFRGVVDDMRAAAFPSPGPAEMEARRRDMESARVRSAPAT